MSTVLFQPEGHIYTVAGARVVSVTQVLRDVGIADFSQVPDHLAEYSMGKGSLVHQTLEMYDNGELDEESLSETLRPYLSGYKEYCSNAGFTPVLCEYVFHNATYRFCGTMDRTGELPSCARYPNGSKAVLDFKCTEGTIKDWVGVQLAAYAGSLVAPHTYRRIALRLRRDGTFTHREFPAAEFQRDWAVFLSALSVFNWKQGAKK